MKIRADVDKKFIRRFLYIGIGCFLFMLWSLYDGLVTNPRELQRALEYKRLYKLVEIEELTEEQRASEWERIIAEKNWAKSKPKEPHLAQNYVYLQWVFFAVGLGLGTFFLGKYLRLLNSWVEADEQGVQTSWGQQLNFSSIQHINKRRWAKKGIARVSYTDATGGKKTMVFDDFKYQRESMGEILRLAERKLRDDQIINGARESESPTEDGGEMQTDFD